jgi:glutamate racemase
MYLDHRHYFLERNMKYIFVFVLGCLAYYHFPAEVEQVVQQAEPVLDQARAAIHEATKPDSTVEQIQNLVK